MKSKLVLLLLGSMIITGCASETNEKHNDLPKAKNAITSKTQSKFSGTIVGTAEVFDRKLNKTVTVTVLERNGKYYDANDGSQLYGYKPQKKVPKLTNKNQGVHELKNH